MKRPLAQHQAELTQKRNHLNRQKDRLRQLRDIIQREQFAVTKLTYQLDEAAKRGADEFDKDRYPPKMMRL